MRQEQVARTGSMEVPGLLGRLMDYPRRARQFLKETRSQLRLVTWPSGREVYSTTVVVVVTVAFFALFFWITDSTFSYVGHWVYTHFAQH